MPRIIANRCLFVGIAFGFLLCLSLQRSVRLLQTVSAQQQPLPLEVRLHRFQLKPDKLAEFNTWVQFEHAHHGETVQTLEREKMYAEAIFRDRDRDPSTIYWLEIRGAGGASTNTSPLAIDKVYEKFMQETLVPHSRNTMTPEYVLIPEFLEQSIEKHAIPEPTGGQR